tara:strand:+ start:762 stop:962 length:201 start_codon:yes stop_codon:yes gene_type:complete
MKNRTTYKGINRAQALKQYREVLEYQKLKAEGKADSLKQKYFADGPLCLMPPTRLQRIWKSIKALF